MFHRSRKDKKAIQTYKRIHWDMLLSPKLYTKKNKRKLKKFETKACKIMQKENGFNDLKHRLDMSDGFFKKLTKKYKFD